MPMATQSRRHGRCIQNAVVSWPFYWVSVPLERNLAELISRVFRWQRKRFGGSDPDPRPGRSVKRRPYLRVVDDSGDEGGRV